MTLLSKTGLLLIIPSVLTMSCVNYLNPIKGNNHVVDQTIVTGNYEKIEVSGSFDVQLISGEEGTITIRTDDNLIDYIVVEENNGVLKIKVDNMHNIRTKNGIKVSVPFKEINAISLSGSGEIETKQAIIKSKTFESDVTGSGNIKVAVDTEKLIADITGSGEIEIIGQTNDLELDITGSGDFEGKDLKTKNTIVSITGSGNAYVQAEKNLNVDIDGSGDVVYSGSPKNKSIDVSGSGSVREDK